MRVLRHMHHVPGIKTVSTGTQVEINVFIRVRRTLGQPEARS